jgi:hypothetical protein
MGPCQSAGHVTLAARGRARAAGLVRRGRGRLISGSRLLEFKFRTFSTADGPIIRLRPSVRRFETSVTTPEQKPGVGGLATWAGPDEMLMQHNNFAIVLAAFPFLVWDTNSTISPMLSSDFDVPYGQFICFRMQSKQLEIKQHCITLPPKHPDSSPNVHQWNTEKILSHSQKNPSLSLSTQRKFSKKLVGISALCFRALPSRYQRAVVSALKLRGAGSTTNYMHIQPSLLAASDRGIESYYGC